MKRIFIINIQSISDIITNSSSEVFVINANNDAFVELMDKFVKSIGGYIKVFSTEEDIKNYFVESFFEYDTFSDFDQYLKFNPLCILQNEFGYYREKFEASGLKVEDIVAACLPAYKSLLGKAILIFEDDCYYPHEIDEFVNIARANKLIEFNTRR
jgi:hypothetical protein